MSVEISTFFTAVELSQKIFEYFGIVESVGYKIDKLSGSFLKSGLNALEDATISNDPDSLIITARDKFLTAIEVESGENLIYSLLGLALCYSHFGDRMCEYKYLKQILKVNVDYEYAKQDMLNFDFKSILVSSPMLCVLFVLYGKNGVLSGVRKSNMHTTHPIKQKVYAYLSAHGECE